MNKIIGTLVPLSALGDGTFASGLVFLDWLQKTHQSAWQLLPLYQTQLEPGSATKRVPSPYKSYGIGLDPKYLPPTYSQRAPTEHEKREFVLDNHDWIRDYALFCALTDHFKTDDWRMWANDVRDRDTDALIEWSATLAKEIDAHITVQWQLHRAYAQLKNKAKELGISLYGDLPFYISVQSPLVWAHKELFQIQKNGSLKYVSGSSNPPSLHFGRQVWGHPLYKWKLHNDNMASFTFWEMRVRYLSRLYDVIRFDYAGGFFEYGVKDPRNEKNDVIKKGPGAVFFEQLIKLINKYDFSLYAEDSGVRLQELRDCLKKLQIPGIKIFRFALNENSGELIEQYAYIADYPGNSVAYTSTHDTETLLNYLHKLTSEQKQKLALAAHVVYDPDDKTFAKTLRDAVLASPAQTVIIPIQDWLLTTDRINIPGTEIAVNDPNWKYHVDIPIADFPTHF